MNLISLHNINKQRLKFESFLLFNISYTKILKNDKIKPSYISYTNVGVHAIAVAPFFSLEFLVIPLRKISIKTISFFIEENDLF